MTSVIQRSIQTGHFQRSLALVAGGAGFLSALEVSSEHYRGSYGQKIMYSPVALSLGLGGAGVATMVSPRAAKAALPIASWLLIGDGVLGFFFHVRGIARKPGGWKLPVTNIVMGPPIFAPLLLTIGGFLGVIASRLAPEGSDIRPRLQPTELRKLLACAAAISGFLNGFEALYSHYKTNFKRRAQWIPVVLTPPIVVAAVASIKSRRIAGSVLAPVSLLAIAAGGVGFFYHVRATLKREGFRERPFYNLIYGTPPLAPLLFAATGFLGVLAALVEPEVRS